MEIVNSTVLSYIYFFTIFSITFHLCSISDDALGLKRINASVEHDDSVIIKGMIARVKHLVKVEEVAPAKKAAPKAKKAEVKEEAAQAAE